MIDCKSCARTFVHQKALQTHLSRTSACHAHYQRLLEKLVRQRPRQVQLDEAEMEDDPVEGWEEPVDPDGIADAAHTFQRDHENLDEERRPKRPRLEEIIVTEEERRSIHSVPFGNGSGRSCGIRATVFEAWRDESERPFGPFKDEEEWDLGAWLMGSGASLTQIENFLKLKIVSSIYLSYQSKLTEHCRFATA